MYRYRDTVCSVTDTVLWAQYRDTVCSVPDHQNKPNIAIKRVTQNLFGFPVHIKVMFTL